MPKREEPYSGDPSLLKENHITALIIDFKKRTVETYVDNPFKHRTGGKYEPVEKPHKFSNSSPFGQIARGLRRMVSNEINNEHRW